MSLLGRTIQFSMYRRYVRKTTFLVFTCREFRILTTLKMSFDGEVKSDIGNKENALGASNEQQVSTRLHTELLYRDKNLPPVIYRSENFVAINKGHDIKINSNDEDEMTVEHQLRKLFPDLVDSDCFHSFRFVHRLDHATSGVMCLALNAVSAAQLHKAFNDRLVNKYYIALVRGHALFKRILIDVPIGKDKSKDWRGPMCVANQPMCHKPRPTTTLALCIELGMYNGKPASKLLLRPFTGRTHQLRVHCAYIGHTIVGDYTYSDRKDTDPFRMMLNAHRLEVDLECDRLDLVAPDIFTPEVDSKWQPFETFLDVNAAVELARQISPKDPDLEVVTLDPGRTT